ncbi:hypothetical protein [Pedobacter sp. ASV12]|uniref:hypothetical protein n=1 Tax=Pedobacter sp. ASV12 TaxID=2795120 RepID=UPI0018ECBE29|nr:hypothetical protein [Pedobacter sp. ASV12]
MLFDGLNTVLGVELHSLGDNSYSCRFCQLAKKDNELHIESNKVIEGPLHKVLESLPKNFPVALTLTGRGIIHKNMQVATDTLPEQVIQQAFPSIEVKDFYVQSYVQGNNALGSIIRRQGVDELLDKLGRAGLKVLMLSLGGIVTAPIWPQLNIYSTEMRFAGHGFVLTAERHFMSYSAEAGLKHDFQVKIEQELIPEENILAYASAFQLVLHEKLTPILANVERVNSAFSDFLGNASLKKKALIFLFGLFGLLLISFGLFSYYNQENAKLAQQVGAQTASADQTDLLQKNIASNEYLLKQLHWNGGYNYGFLLNEIGKSMPRQLSLHEVAVNDFKTDAEKAERQPSIKILGSTDNLTAVNNWIFVLKEMPWVKSAKLLKYQEDQETTAYQFSLIITY